MSLENNSDKSIGVSAELVSINDCMVTNLMSSQIEPNKKVNDTFGIIGERLSDYGVEEYAKVGFRLHLYDADTYEGIADSDYIETVVEGKEDFVQEVDETGDVLYDDNDILIVSKGLAEESIYGEELLIYVYNKTDRDIIVEPEDVSVNGFMINTLCMIQVPAGKHAIDSLEFLSKYLEENDITDVEEIEFSIEVMEDDTFQDILSIDPVVVNCK